MTIIPTQHEKSEWARFGVALEKAKKYDLANEFRAASKIEERSKIDLRTFDYLQAKYRAWLAFNGI